MSDLFTLSALSVLIVASASASSWASPAWAAAR